MGILKDEYAIKNPATPVTLPKVNRSPTPVLKTNYTPPVEKPGFFESLVKPLVDYGKFVGEGVAQGGRYLFNPTFRKLVNQGPEALTYDELTKVGKEQPSFFLDPKQIETPAKTWETGIRKTVGAMSYVAPVTGGPVTALAAKGALAGAGMAFSEDNAGLKDVAIGAATGAVLNPALHGVTNLVGRGIKSLATKIFPGVENTTAKGLYKGAQNLLENGVAPKVAGEVGPSVEVSGARKLFDRAKNIIASQGESGKQLSTLLDTVRNDAETTAGNWVANMPTVGKLTKQEFTNFVDVAEGNAKPINDVVSQAVNEWSVVRDQIANAASDLGLLPGSKAGAEATQQSLFEQFGSQGAKVENYFPHIFDEKMFKGDNFTNAVKHLVKTGQAPTEADAVALLRHAKDVLRNRRQSNLELERIFNLPGYEKTKDALYNYVESAAKRMAEVKNLGKGDAVANDLIAKVMNEGGDANTVRKMFDISVGAQKYGEDAMNLSRKLRAFQSVTKLGTGAISNVGQSVNTASVTGILRTIKNIPNALFDQESKDFALRSGVTLDGVLNDLREAQGWGGKTLGQIAAPGFNAVEKFNRRLAALAGKDYAESMARLAVKGNKNAITELEKMGINVAEIAPDGILNEQQIVKSARNIVERTQFKVDPMDLPGWENSPAGRLIGQFRTFSYNQSAFVARDLIAPAMRGNFAPITRFLILGLPVGAALRSFRNFIKGQDVSDETLSESIARAYNQVGGAGLAGDVATGFFPEQGKYVPPDRAASQAFGAVFGPTAGDFAETAGALSELKQGRSTAVKRLVIKKIPLVGPTLKNKFYPYKPAGSSNKLSPLPAVRPR